MISYNTDLVQGVMKVLDDAGLFDLSVPEIIKLVEEKFTSTNKARDEICANTPCSYCELEPMCKFKVNHQPCFEGRKLSPVA